MPSPRMTRSGTKPAFFAVGGLRFLVDSPPDIPDFPRLVVKSQPEIQFQTIPFPHRDLTSCAIMARQSKSKKSRGQKNTKNTVKVANGNTAAVAGGAVAIGKRTIKCPGSIEDLKRTRTSSSNAQSTASNAPKPRADSISAMELNDMVSKQLLAELESSMCRVRSRRNTTSVSSIPVDRQESTLATGSQESSNPPVKVWSYTGAVILLCVILVLLFVAWR